MLRYVTLSYVSYGSVSAFQVGIGFSVYGRYFFQVGSVLLSVFQNIAISVRFFGISLCVNAPCADPKILLPSQSADFDQRWGLYVST